MYRPLEPLLVHSQCLSLVHKSERIKELPPAVALFAVCSCIFSGSSDQMVGIRIPYNSFKSLPPNIIVGMNALRRFCRRVNRCERLRIWRAIRGSPFRRRLLQQTVAWSDPTFLSSIGFMQAWALLKAHSAFKSKGLQAGTNENQRVDQIEVDVLS
jgi:hypothetical protein